MLKKIFNDLKNIKVKSICKRKKVITIIYNNKFEILAYGINNNPISFFNNKCESNKIITYNFVTHSEIEALTNLSNHNKIKNINCIIIFISTLPCYNCAKHIYNFKIKYGIKIIKILYQESYHSNLSLLFFKYKEIPCKQIFFNKRM